MQRCDGLAPCLPPATDFVRLVFGACASLLCTQAFPATPTLIDNACRWLVFFGILMLVFLCFAFSILGPQYSASVRCCLHVCLAGASAVLDCLCYLPSSWFYAPQTPAIKTNMCMSSLLSHFCCLCWNMQSSAVFTFRFSLWVSGSVTQESPALQPCWIKRLRWSFRGARVIVFVCAGQCCVFQQHLCTYLCTPTSGHAVMSCPGNDAHLCVRSSSLAWGLLVPQT